MAAIIAHRNLPQALLRAREAVMRYFRPNLKIAGVTEQQWRVIRALSDLAGGNALFDFTAFVEQASATSATILRRLLPVL